MKVGCGITISPENPVSLEYSFDQGRTWELVKSSWLQYGSGPDAVLQAETPSVYYSNSHYKWQRIVVPLYGLKICGLVAKICIHNVLKCNKYDDLKFLFYISLRYYIFLSIYIVILFYE